MSICIGANAAVSISKPFLKFISSTQFTPVRIRTICSLDAELYTIPGIAHMLCAFVEAFS